MRVEIDYGRRNINEEGSEVGCSDETFKPP